MNSVFENPETPVETSFLSPTISWKKWRLPHPPSGGFGLWAEQAGLYSKGSDFTAAHIRAGVPGRSMLRRLWLGTNEPQPYVETTVWTLHGLQDQPCGVFVWEKTKSDKSSQWADGFLAQKINGQSIGCQCLGRISMWLSPQHRQRGWMSGLIEDIKHELIGAAEKAFEEGSMPFLRGADAAPLILQKHTSIPLTHSISPGKEEDHALKDLLLNSSNSWSLYQQSLKPPRSNFNR